MLRLPPAAGIRKTVLPPAFLGSSQERHGADPAGMPGPISGWERGGLRPIIRAHWRAGYLRTEAHLPENPLALPHAQPHPEAAPEVLGKIRAVPGVRAQTGIPRAPAQIRLQLAPLRCIERSGPTRFRAFPQRLQPALLEAMHPALYGGVIFTEEH